MPDCAGEELDYVSEYLTHFVGRGLTDDEAFARLCAIIRSRKLLPGGSESHWAGNLQLKLDKPLSSNELFTPEMVCFCDIPLHERMLEIHTRKYSKFGLAFDKAWLARHRGASPVFYLAKGSVCTDHRYPQGHPDRITNREGFFDLAAHDWMKDVMAKGSASSDRPRSENMILWYILCYCKFFDETLEKAGPDNFYMEREWRTIGQVQFCVSDIAKVVLPEGYRQEFLDGFANDSCSDWLKTKIWALGAA